MDSKSSRSRTGLSMVVMSVIWNESVRHEHHGLYEFQKLNGLSMVVMNIIWDGRVRYVHHGSKEL
jgi:putative heme degradation protein